MKLSKKLDDRNLNGIFRLMLLVYGKNMCQNLCRIIKEYHDKKQIFAKCTENGTHKLRVT